MRLFVAIEVPEDIRRKLADLQTELRAAAPSAKWVRAESAHLTLRYIGELQEKRLPALDEALAVCAWKPFEIVVRGVGFFPGAKSPRVLWVGLKAPAMQDLEQKIEVRLQPLGLPPDGRAFRPHITMARAGSSRLERSLVEASRQFEDYDFGTFTADRCFLYESTLKPTGAVYTKLKEYPAT